MRDRNRSIDNIEMEMERANERWLYAIYSGMYEHAEAEEEKARNLNREYRRLNDLSRWENTTSVE